jgi:hypothetical protein
MNKDLLEQAIVFGIALDRIQQEEIIIEEPNSIEEEELEPFKLSRTFTIEVSED